MRTARISHLKGVSAIGLLTLTQAASKLNEERWRKVRVRRERWSQRTIERNVNHFPPTEKVK